MCHFLSDFLFFFSFSIFKNHLKDNTSYYKKELSKFNSQNMYHPVKMVNLCERESA